jgi:hypothetical protein
MTAEPAAFRLGEENPGLPLNIQYEHHRKSHCHCIVCGNAGNLSVRFLHPVPWDAPLEIRANIVATHRILYRLESEIVSENRQLARGAARFMVPREDLKKTDRA